MFLCCVLIATQHRKLGLSEIGHAKLRLSTNTPDNKAVNSSKAVRLFRENKTTTKTP